MLPVVDVYATQRHFLDHVQPVWEALPEEMRGALFTQKRFAAGVPDLPTSPRAGAGDLLLMCSFGDLKYATVTNTRPIVFMEHGAGMTFQNEHGYVFSSYAGSLERPRVCLFLNVNEYAAAANARAHPRTESAIIGSPKMDRWYPLRPSPRHTPNYDTAPTVAITFHWDGRLLSPGIGNAYEHFRQALPRFVQDGPYRPYRTIGHAHPRFQKQMRLECLALDIPFVDRLEDVFEQADLLVGDATSALYEFASLGRPVVVMNAPFYHQEPDRGVRFWQHIPGIQVDEPDDLAQATLTALADPPGLQAIRRSAVEAVYPFRGDAAERAVAALQNFADLCRISDPTAGSPTQNTLRDMVRKSMRTGEGIRFKPIDETVDVTKGVSTRG